MAGVELSNMPDWPAGMSVEIALAYTGVSQAQIRIWQRDGLVKFLPIGPSGKLIAQRRHLDEALRSLFTADDLSEDLDFGDLS